jgi:Uma2 family endonuclease
MSAPATQMTAAKFAEFCALPEHADRRYELVRGELVEMSLSDARHNRIVFWVASLLQAYAARRGGGTLLGADQALIVAADAVRGADLAFFHRTLPDDDAHAGWLAIPPELVIEVVSPQDRFGEIMDKVAEYLAFGVPQVWVVEPELRQVVVYCHGVDPRVCRRGQKLHGIGELADLALAVDEMFAFPGAKP